MHICMDEIVAFFASVTALRFGWSYARTAWLARHQKPGCVHDHEHVHEVTEDMIVEEVT